MRFAECKNYQESVGLLFWQASMLWQRHIRQALQPYDLTHTQFVILAVLEELSEQSVGITQKQIADFSMIDVMTVSSTVRLLEKKGLVCRLPNQKDTRALRRRLLRWSRRTKAFSLGLRRRTLLLRPG